MDYPDPHSPIVFYDGNCPLCNRVVKLILLLDRYNQFQFAPLAGQTAQHLPSNPIATDPETLWLLEDGRWYCRSTAVLRVFTHFPFLKWVAAILFHIPLYWRDAIYNGVARHRQNYFTRCPIIPPRYRHRFLP